MIARSSLWVLLSCPTALTRHTNCVTFIVHNSQVLPCPPWHPLTPEMGPFLLSAYSICCKHWPHFPDAFASSIALHQASDSALPVGSWLPAFPRRLLYRHPWTQLMSIWPLRNGFQWLGGIFLSSRLGYVKVGCYKWKMKGEMGYEHIVFREMVCISRISVAYYSWHNWWCHFKDCIKTSPS